MLELSMLFEGALLRPSGLKRQQEAFGCLRERSRKGEGTGEREERGAVCRCCVCTCVLSKGYTLFTHMPVLHKFYLEP